MNKLHYIFQLGLVSEDFLGPAETNMARNCHDVVKYL